MNMEASMTMFLLTYIIIPVIIYILITALAFIGYSKTEKTGFALLMLFGIVSIIGVIPSLYLYMVAIPSRNIAMIGMIGMINLSLYYVSLILLLIAIYTLVSEIE